MLVNETSTSILVEELMNISVNLLSPAIQSVSINGQQTKKLDYRYESHKNFLIKYIPQYVIPKCLILELEPKIYSYTYEFLDN